MIRLIVPAVLAMGLAGAAMAETRALTGFTGVNASAGTDVTVSVGGAHRVNVTGRDAARIETRVEGDTLIVTRERNWRPRGHVQAEIHVTMPRVDSLSASSGAELEATGVAADTLRLHASSGGDLEVAGSCGALRASASSGAHINARDTRCGSGHVDASSGAHAAVYVDGPLDVDASSGGGVIASGDARIGNISLSSGGTLRRR